MAKRKSTATGTTASTAGLSAAGIGGNVPYIFVRDGQTVAKWAADDAIIDASMGTGNPDTYATLADCFDDYGITPRPGDELVQLAELFRAVPQVDPEYRAEVERITAEQAAGQAAAPAKPLGPKQLRAQQMQMQAQTQTAQQGGGVIPVPMAMMPAGTMPVQVAPEVQTALHLLPHMMTAQPAAVPAVAPNPTDEAARQLAEFMASQSAAAVSVPMPAPVLSVAVPAAPVYGGAPDGPTRIGQGYATTMDLCMFLESQRSALAMFPAIQGKVVTALTAGMQFAQALQQL